MERKRQIDEMANILYSDEWLECELVESVRIAEVLLDAGYRRDLGPKDLPVNKEKQIKEMAEALDQAEQIHLGRRSYSPHGWSKIATMLYENGYRKCGANSIELACVVGNVLYFPITDKVLLYDVVEIKIKQDATKIVCESRIDKTSMTLPMECVGRTIFRTLKEAERALSNRQLLKNEIAIANGGI